MMIWFDVERIKQNKIKGNIRKEGGVKFFVFVCFAFGGWREIFFFKGRNLEVKENKTTELKMSV